MRIFALVFLLVTCVFGDKIVTIATYNVENLFDMKKDRYEYKEYKPNGISKWNRKNYNIKLKNLSRVIKDIDADIIALQEIESYEALKALKKTLKREGIYYPYIKIADKKNTTIKVALLSKIPFVYAKEVRVTSSYRYRNILEVKFNIDGKDLYIFVNHWKSKSGAESKRIISAKALLKRIKQLGYDKNIILLGDFNSAYEEYKKFKNKKRHNDTNGKTGINHVLKTLKQQDRASHVEYEKNNFYNLWYDVDKDKRYTYIYNGKSETLDNMLISQSLLDKKDVYYMYESVKPVEFEYLFKGKKIYRWQTTRKKPRKHKGKGYSDHLPMVAKFVFVE